MFFSLRNIKLRLNQLLDLKLDIEGMASSMATAMAVMHWAAKTDARDVEFVLGSSAIKTPPIGAIHDADEIANLPPLTYTGPPSFRHDEGVCARKTGMFVLDFNQCRPITLDAAGVVIAVDAVMINDSYVPRPGRKSHDETRVWDAFAKRYIEVSTQILGKDSQLPHMFLQGFAEAQVRRDEKMAAQRAAVEARESDGP
jgi:hypothetical protein